MIEEFFPLNNMVCLVSLKLSLNAPTKVTDIEDFLSFLLRILCWSLLCFLNLIWRANKIVNFLEIYVLAINIFDLNFIGKFE